MRVWTKEKYDKVIAKRVKQIEKSNAKYEKRLNKEIAENNKYIAIGLKNSILKHDKVYFVSCNVSTSKFTSEGVVDIIKKTFPFLHFKYELSPKTLKRCFYWSEEPFEN